MGTWPSRLWRTLSRASAAAERSRRALQVARQDRTTLVLEPPTAPTMAPITLHTTIEQVRATDIIIAQPIYEGTTRQLVSGEALRISFTVQPFGHLTGRTRVLGRLKLPSDTDGRPFYGYRLAIPEVLRKADRRRAQRATIGFELSREAEIYKSNDQVPIRGVVQNVSTTGMQIRTHNARPLLSKDERVRLVVYLPPPVGEVNRVVTVARVTCDRNPRFRLVALSFDRELSGFADLIKNLRYQRDDKQTRRRAG